MRTLLGRVRSAAVIVRQEGWWMLAKKVAIFVFRLPVSPYPSPAAPLPAGTARQPSWPSGSPLVSVIVPCFDYGRFVREALDSVRGQTLRDHEVIVVDDGSTDPFTLGVLEDLRADGIRVERQPNQGLARTRNNAARMARGKYLCFLDADDLLEPTYLEKAVTLLERHPGLGSAYSWVQCFEGDQTLWKVEDLDPVRLSDYNVAPSQSVIRRSAWEAVRARNGAGFDSTYDGCFEDWVFWIDMVTAGFSGRAVPEALIRYRIHGTSLSARNRPRFDRMLAVLKKDRAAFFTARGRRRTIDPAFFREVKAENAFENLGRPEQYLETRPAVVFVLPWLECGGVEGVTLEVVRRLRQEGVAVHVLTTAPSRHEWHDRFRALTPFVYHLDRFVDEGELTEFLANFVLTRRPDVVCGVHSRAFYDVAPRLKAGRAAPLVCDVLHNDSRDGYMDRAVQADAEVDFHVVVTERIGESLRERGVDPSRIRVIANGVDTGGAFRPDRTRVEEAPEGTVRVLFLGRLSKEKRPLDFVRLAEACREEPRLRFLLAGEGRLRDDVERAARTLRLENLEILGEVDPRAALAGSHVLVITSESEGLPLAALEALSMGNAVVSTDVGEVARVVRDGEAGFVVPAVGDTEAFRERLLEYLHRPGLLEAHRARARRLVETAHSSETMGEAYLRTFGLAGPPRASRRA